LILVHLDANASRAGVLHAEPIGGRLGKIEDAPTGVRATIIDLDFDRLTIPQIGHRRLGAERQPLVRRGEFMLIEPLAARRLPAVKARPVP
jgi:hypothetical protein